MADKQVRLLLYEFRRQLAANQAALRRLESLCSEEMGRCYVTEQVRRAVKRGLQVEKEIALGGQGKNFSGI